MPEGTTSVSAGHGYTDDRPDRRVNEPCVGDKESNFAIVDAMSPVLPWIMDRDPRKIIGGKTIRLERVKVARKNHSCSTTCTQLRGLSATQM
jgi:hypothetical protein